VHLHDEYTRISDGSRELTNRVKESETSLSQITAWFMMRFHFILTVPNLKICSIAAIKKLSAIETTFESWPTSYFWTNAAIAIAFLSGQSDNNATKMINGLFNARNVLLLKVTGFSVKVLASKNTTTATLRICVSIR
jgi:hypothetical protein